MVSGYQKIYILSFHVCGLGNLMEQCLTYYIFYWHWFLGSSTLSN